MMTKVSYKAHGVTDWSFRLIYELHNWADSTDARLAADFSSVRVCI